MTGRAPATTSFDAAAAPPSARVHVCGTLYVEIDERRCESKLGGRRVRAMFAYLLRHRGRQVTRVELLDALWGESLPEGPEGALATTLARLRRALGAPAIVGRDRLQLDLGINPEVDVEVAAECAHAAEEALSLNDHELALELSRRAHGIAIRPLFPDLDEPWASEWRDEVAALEAPLLEVMATAALAVGGPRLATAERTARILVDREPFRESGYALLIQACARSGNVAEASRTFHRLRQLLRDELGTTPSTVISELHERLLRASDDDGGGPPPRHSSCRAAGDPALTQPPRIADDDGPLLERDDQLGALARMWARARAGQRHLSAVVGEAGVGKTRIAAEFAATVHAAGGGTVLYGAADEGVHLPYQPFVEALRRHLATGGLDRGSIPHGAEELAPVIPELALNGQRCPLQPGGDPELERYRVLELFNELIEAVAQQAPTLLILDDLHWAHPSVPPLLRYVLRAQRAVPLMTLALFRDTEPTVDRGLAALVADLHRVGRGELIELQALSQTATALLVGGQLERPVTAGFVTSLHECTSGNPLFIKELLCAIDASEPECDVELSAATLDGRQPPPSVVRIIENRLTQLPAATVNALRAASVVGCDFDLNLVAAALGGDDEEEALDALEPAMESGLVRELSDHIDRFSFVHPLFHSSLTRRLSASRRARLQARLNSALAIDEGAA